MDNSKLFKEMESFEKSAQSASDIDNLVLSLTGLYSLSAFVEQKVNSEQINKLLEEAKKLRTNNPQDVAKAKQMLAQIKGAADYLKKICELIKI